jgi:hypothetical protein
VRMRHACCSSTRRSPGGDTGRDDGGGDGEGTAAGGARCGGAQKAAAALFGHSGVGTSSFGGNHVAMVGRNARTRMASAGRWT